jgi:hypothetical protein
MNMIEEIEQSKNFGAFNIIEFLKLLHVQGFLKLNGPQTALNRDLFKVTYEDTNPSSLGNQVTINHSSAGLYKAMKWGWAPTLASLSALGLGVTGAIGASALGVSAPVVIGAASCGLIASGIWAHIVDKRVTDRYAEAFTLDLEYGAKSVISPEKMILETLSAYHLLQGIPQDARLLDLAGVGPNNDAFTGLSALLRATKNTLIFWDQFKYNMEDPSTGIKSAGKVGDLRTDEFDANIDKYKNHIANLPSSLLRWHNVRDWICDIGLTIGCIGAGTSAWAIVALF